MRNIPWSNTVVVDVDDTISTHFNRDYENAIPHIEMIDKLNKMYDMGYRIVYFTARGQLSCKGNLDLINERKRPTLEKWLDNNNVKYDELIFGKPLGLWYVDDKAIRPDEFLDLKIEELHGGSGAKVRREGDSVIKECRNAFDQAQWYRKVNGYVNAPGLHSIIENTIKIDYIEGLPGEKIKNTWQLDKILQEVQKIRAVESKNIPDFTTYINRIEDHLNHEASNELEQETKDKIVNLLKENQYEFDNHKSYCHGDLTLGNIIIKGKLSRDTEAFLFDPNVPEGIWTSYLLDLSKLNQSLRFDYEYKFMGAKKPYSIKLKEHFNNSMSSDVLKLVMILEITHWVRMIKYKPAEELKPIFFNIRTLLSLIEGEESE